MNRKIRLTVNLITVLVLTGWLLSNAGRFLVYTEPPVHADVMIVLSGDDGRLEKGIELYRKGYADRILLTNAREFAKYNGDVYDGSTLRGIPDAPIIREDNAESTYQNALYAKKLLAGREVYSVIVVSSDYHMRRVKYLFDRVFRHTGIQLTYCAADSGYRPSRWWATRKDIVTTASEYVKMVANAFGVQGRGVKDFWYGPEKGEEFHEG